MLVSYVIQWTLTTVNHHYSEPSDEGYSKRGQTSQQRTNQKYSVYTPKEDNLSTKDKMLGFKHVHYSEVPL